MNPKEISNFISDLVSNLVSKIKGISYIESKNYFDSKDIAKIIQAYAIVEAAKIIASSIQEIKR